MVQYLLRKKVTNSDSQWLMSPGSGYSGDAWHVDGTGFVKHGGYGIGADNGVRALAVLKSNVKVTNGEGTETNPYKIKLET